MPTDEEISISKAIEKALEPVILLVSMTQYNLLQEKNFKPLHFLFYKYKIPT